MSNNFQPKLWAMMLLGSALAVAACASITDHESKDSVARTSEALQPGPDGGAVTTTSDPVPCAAWSSAAVANTGSITLNAGTLVDSYVSSNGQYGGTNVKDGVVVQAATTITNNGGAVRGNLLPNSPAHFSVVPVPTGAINLPLGSATPGSLNINTAADSITLAPGNYVASNISVNFPGAINISPAGRVRIWITGNLNLGGNENLRGAPSNLAFLVTGSSFVNVNSNGALYGMIYAPTSSIAVNSSVFGAVVGGSVSFLNSGAALHFDQSSVCAQASSGPGVVGVAPLPQPPQQAGCYIGTLNGWIPVPCMDPKTIISGFVSFDVSDEGLATVASAGSTLPLVYGQVDSTMVIGSETNGTATGNNQWGIQLNSNTFNCPSPVTGLCWDQFVVVADGAAGHTAVCIETWQNGTANWNDQNFCVGANGQQETATNGLDFKVTTRVGALQAGDFANVAAYAYTAGGKPLIGMVAQFNWVSSEDQQPTSETALLNRIPGLYSVVTPDQYGLAKSWTNIAGGLMGADNRSAANFTNAEVFQRYALSDCAGDVSAAGPTCPTQPSLSASNVQVQFDSTSAETNNLSLVPSPKVSFPNSNLAVTDVFATTSTTGAGSGTCLASVPNHIFIKDNEGDNGGTNSNAGGVPFWESPDIFVVPSGAPTPGVNDTPADVELTAGAQYQVYLRIHNDYGCSDVPGPLSVYIDAADPNLGFSNWEGVTLNAAAGSYDSYGSASQTIVKAFGTAIIGPFPWKPDVGGHKCLLAAISGPNETAPTVSATAPVLPPAYTSNQIAQRNVQIGSSCSYSITNPNSTSANLVLGISVTPATPAPGASGGPTVSLVIGDAGGVWAAEWKNLPGLSSVTNDGTNTTVVLSSSYVALTSVPLAGHQSPAVSINIDTPAGQQPTVNVSAILTDPLSSTILQENGGSCTGTAEVIVVR